jgi:inosine/xanthosine triphosphate pyrophosphatase family protein
MSIASRLGLMKDINTSIIVLGIVEGVIVDPIVKEPGIREFETFFQPDGLDKPLIAFSPTDVLPFSHRGKALAELVRALKEKGEV